jgi:hypothetical protein
MSQSDFDHIGGRRQAFAGSKTCATQMIAAMGLSSCAMHDRAPGGRQLVYPWREA